MFKIFFDIEGTVHKQLVLASQTVYSAYYCDASRRLRENVRRLRPELWRRKNWQLHHDNAPSHTSLFNWELFTKKTLLSFPHAPYFSLFPRLKKKKGYHFDTVLR
jgi:hypothetical protein